jgi:hypothetical protein
MSAIEPPDNLLEIRNATMRVSRIESNTQTMTANLEVGTTLAVSGNTTLSSNLVVGGNVQVGTANLFVDTVSSNVGVGTNLPLAKLDVKGDIGLVGNIYSDSNLSVQYTTENPSNTWAQVGGDLNGEAAGDRFGHDVALSSDGTRLAVGAILNDGTGSNAGHVRVFNWSGSAWIQLGGDIDGEAANDNFGVSVALSSDGTRLAVGGYANDGTGTDAGHVRVFNWSGSAWIQLGGDIDGEAAGDYFGSPVTLSSDGTRLAVGAYANDGTGTDAGHARVFEYHQGSSTWIQLGGDIDGEAAGDHFGVSVALSSDGTRLAVGAHLNDGTGSNAGHVRVFDWSGSAWTQVGADIDGEAADDNFGVSVALSSDGTRLAVGGYLNDGTGSNAGHVRVFDLVGSTWTQVGGDIDGEAAGDFFGFSVALSSDGTRLAVSASATGSNAGHVRVFDLVGGVWTQIGGDLDGVAAEDYFGQSVALSSDGTRLAVGGPLNDGNGTDAGHVRVFDYDGVLKTKQIIKEDIVEIPGDLRAGCPVYFSATFTAYTGTDTFFNFDSVHENKGGGLHGTTFTAPITGLYYFSFFCTSNWESANQTGGSRIIIQWYKNNSVQGGNNGLSHIYNQDPSYSTFMHMNTSISAMFQLNKNDIIQIKNYDHTVTAAYNCFSGFYLSS